MVGLGQGKGKVAQVKPSWGPVRSVAGNVQPRLAHERPKAGHNKPSWDPVGLQLEHVKPGLAQARLSQGLGLNYSNHSVASNLFLPILLRRHAIHPLKHPRKI